MSRKSDGDKAAVRPDRSREVKAGFPLALVGQQVLIGNGAMNAQLGSNPIIKPARVRKRLTSS